MAKYTEIKKGDSLTLIEYEKEQKIKGEKYKQAVILNGKEIPVENVQIIDKFIKWTDVVTGKPTMMNMDTTEKVLKFDRDITDVVVYNDAATFKYEGKQYITVNGKISEGYDSLELISPFSKAFAFQGGKVQVRDGGKWFFINKNCQPVDNQRFPVEFYNINVAAYDLAKYGIAQGDAGAMDEQLDISLVSRYEFDFVSGKKVAGITHDNGLRRVYKFPEGSRKEYWIDLAGNRIEAERLTPEFENRAKKIYDVCAGKVKIEEISPELLTCDKSFKTIKAYIVRNILADYDLEHRYHFLRGEEHSSSMLRCENAKEQSLYEIMKCIEDVVAVAGMDALEYNLISENVFTPEQEKDIKTRYKQAMQELEEARERAFNPEIER